MRLIPMTCLDPSVLELVPVLSTRERPCDLDPPVGQARGKEGGVGGVLALRTNVNQCLV